jgi:hypothetical protein
MTSMTTSGSVRLLAHHDRRRTRHVSIMAWLVLVLSGVLEAVWVGVGASLTVVYGMVSGAESVSAIKVVLLMGLLGCVIGLRLAHWTPRIGSQAGRLRTSDPGGAHLAR